MITDSQIQAAPNVWNKITGPDIGGTAPSSYGITQGTPSSASAALFRTSGEPYTDWLAYSSRWIPPGVSQFALDFDFWIDARVLKCAQALEFDLKSKTFDFSAQVDINAGWMWQVDKQNVWVNVGPIAPLVAYTKHHFTIAGKFGATSYSPLSVTIDGKTLLVPTSLQNQPATDTNWTPGIANIQVQQDANATGGEFQTQIDNMILSWS